MKPAIVSLFMRNINPQAVKLQIAVVNKFNKSSIQHYPILTDHNPGYSMDLGVEAMRKAGHDAVMFLDIDALPLTDFALDYLFEQAYAGKLIGSAQRSGHIDNGEHIFAAPHNVTFTLETYDKIGKPSFLPNIRGDVAEELTWKAEESNIPVEILMPTRFDAPPIRMDWEPKDAPPYWDLGKDKPRYGIGTTFGNEKGELFWHMFQSFHPGQHERFVKKCEEILNG
jgi:hypothetical protein